MTTAIMALRNKSENFVFDGPVYEPARDNARLTSQFLAVRDYMLSSYPEWHTLENISNAVAGTSAYQGRWKASVPSVSAQLRHMRKSRFGGFVVEKRYVHNGLWEYRATARPLG